MRRKSNVGIIVLVVLAIVFILLGTIPFMVFGTYMGGPMAKATGGSGCYLPDSSVSDTSATTELIMTKLLESGRYKSQIDSLGRDAFTKKVDEIVAKGRQEKINPVLVVGIWWGEQEFQHPEKAFGYAYFDSGASKEATSGSNEDRWQYQLQGVYKTIKKAQASVSPYDTPPATDVTTRLFYHYAEAMRNQYNESGKQWLESYSHPQYGNPYYKRINVIKQVQPSLITCVAGQSTGISSGKYACPTEARYAQASNWGDTLSNKNYKIGTYPGHEGYDIMTPVGARIFSVSDGKVVKIKDTDTDRQSDNNVTIEEKPNVFWYYTHLDNEIDVKVGDTVKKGQPIAKVGSYVRDNGERVHHLHIGISKRSNDRPTLGERYNWSAWYYPYEFLKDVSCLNPPKANVVKYP